MLKPLQSNALLGAYKNCEAQAAAEAICKSMHRLAESVIKDSELAIYKIPTAQTETISLVAPSLPETLTVSKSKLPSYASQLGRKYPLYQGDITVFISLMRKLGGKIYDELKK